MKSFVVILIVGTLWLTIWLVERSKQARIGREIRFLCPQFGFTYLDEIPVSQLGPLHLPPWTAFTRGLVHPNCTQTLTAQRTTGTIFCAQFQGYFFRDDGDEVQSSMPCSMLGLKLLEHQQHLVDFCVGLHLKNGLHVVVRGEDIYAMFAPRHRRSMAMSYRERMQCMSAMLRMLEGDLVRAEELFAKICGVSPQRVAFLTGIALGAFALWWWVIVLAGGHPAAILVPPGTGVLLCFYQQHVWRVEVAAFMEYLQLKVQY